MSKRKSDNDTLPVQHKRLATYEVYDGYYPPTDAGKATFHQGVQQLNCLDYQNAIATATHGMTDMFESMLALQSLRAHAYCETKQFDKGLKDAIQLIDYAPLKATGYLIAGRLHVSQSQYKKAMEVYKQGLETVPLDDHKDLQQRYNDAKEKADRRVDFVARLPYDLLYHVLDYLSTTTLLEALHVSRYWHDRISTYDEPWTQLVVDQSFTPSNIAGLSSISHHIMHLEISDLDNASCDSIFLQMMNRNYANLNVLEVLECKLLNYGRWMIALWHVKDTLTELVISMASAASPAIPIGVILTTCSNLKRLECVECRKGVSTGETLGSMPTTPVESLTDLSLDICEMELKTWESILRCCPNLQRLEIQNCQSYVVELAHKLCPRLTMFSFNQPLYDQSDERTFSGDILHRLCMTLQSSESVIGPRDMLLHFAPVVEEMYLEFLSDGAGRAEDLSTKWNPIVATTYTNLKSLSLTVDEPYERLTSRLLLCCPNLERLSLPECSKIDDEALQAILQLKKLRSLTLEGFYEVNFDALTSMFAGLSAPGAPTLDTVEISNVEYEFTDEFMQRLAAIPSLKKIKLANLSFEFQDAPKNFAIALRDGPTSLTRITFNDIFGLNDEVLGILKEVATLEIVSICSLGTVTHHRLQ